MLTPAIVSKEGWSHAGIFTAGTSELDLHLFLVNKSRVRTSSKEAIAPFFVIMPVVPFLGARIFTANKRCNCRGQIMFDFNVFKGKYEATVEFKDPHSGA